MDSEKELLDAFNRVVHEDFPNPQRIDCPGREVLLKLAQQPADAQFSPLLDHVRRCAPCFDELKDLRCKAQKRYPEIRPSRLKEIARMLETTDTAARAAVWREVRRARLKSLKRSPRRGVNEPMALASPHKNVSNVLSIEALIASSPVTQRHLDFDLFDI